MLQASTILFLKQLQKNNNKPWFDENRKTYEAAKADFTTLVAQLIESTAKLDPAFAQLQPKDCMFRINRDVRFSKDKSPYKTNFGASINAGGKKVNLPGFYFHCEPGKSFAGGGLYMPMPPELAKIRQEIDYNFSDWQKIVTHKSFVKYFKAVDGIAVLSRPPKGYDDQNPAIEFLKMKSFTGIHQIEDSQLLQKNLVKEITKTFEALKPMTDFLLHALQ
jgi:uncharacterized protein (TIGR02453 family)